MEEDIVGYLCSICKTANLKETKYCISCGQWLLSDLSKPIPIYKSQFNKYFGKYDLASKPKSSKALLVWFWVLFAFYFSTTDQNNKNILAFFLLVFGAINVIYPIPAVFNIKNRKQATAVLILGFILIIAFGPKPK